MPFRLFISCLLLACQPIALHTTLPTDYEALSADLLLQVKTESDYAAQLNDLQRISLDDLSQQLNADAKRLAFWLNIYNAFIQIKARTDRHLLENDKKTFFKRRFIPIGNEQFSFDDIEHGILRHSKNKISLGYWGKCFVSQREKKLRVEQLDYRIHFALNCGAKSCPPIAFYESADIDRQLRLATAAYLQSECTYKDQTLYVPKLFWWFKADFGGREGMLRILKANEIDLKNEIPNLQKVRIEYRAYDWTLFLDNYSGQ